MALRFFLVGLVASLALEFPGESGWTDQGRSVSVEQSRQADRSMPNGLEVFATAVPLAVAQPVRTDAPMEMARQPEAIVPVVTVAAADKIEIHPMPMPAPAPEVAETPVPTVAQTDLPPAPAVEELKKAPMIEVVDLDAAPPSDPDAGFKAVVEGMVTAFAADATSTPPATEPAAIVAETEVRMDEVVDLDPALAELPGYAIEKAAVSETLDQTKGCVEPEVLENPAPEAVGSGRLNQAVRLTGLALNAWGAVVAAGCIGRELASLGRNQEKKAKANGFRGGRDGKAAGFVLEE